nr:helix-turn-helix transcriptional regulator [Micromonospora sp. DSM 115978]
MIDGRSAVASEPAFTLRAQWLGQQLREMREGAGLTLKDVGNYIQRDGSTVSRMESGMLPARVPEVLTYLDLCGVDDPKRRSDLKKMAEDVWQKGWWDGFAADVAGSLVDWIWLESRAARVSAFEVSVIPGLLQTQPYAEALIRMVDSRATERQIARFVEVRMARQQRLDGEDPINLAVVIDEGALRRPVGGIDVMRDQLEHLQRMARRRTIEIRVLPSETGAHPSPEGAFNVLGMRRPYPMVGCISTPAGNLVVEGEKAQALLQTYDRIREMALAGTAARSFVSELMRRLEG